MWTTLLYAMIGFVLIFSTSMAIIVHNDRTTKQVRDHEIKRVRVVEVNGKVLQDYPAGTFAKGMINQYLAGNWGLLYTALQVKPVTKNEFVFRITYNDGSVREEREFEGSHRFKQLMEKVKKP